MESLIERLDKITKELLVIKEDLEKIQRITAAQLSVDEESVMGGK